MTEEEFRAKLGIPPATGRTPPTGGGGNVSTQGTGSYGPPTSYQPAPTPPPPAAPARAPARNFPTKGGFRASTPVKLPLKVRQSQKDGRFYLAGSISFSVEVDEAMYQEIQRTRQGLNEYKAGEVTIWPAFEKKG